MTGKSGQKRAAHKRALPLEEYQSLAQGLLGEFKTYYGAAKAIGDRNLRAGFRRLLLANHPPSERLRKALEAWADIDILIIEVVAGSNIFGTVGLLELSRAVNILILAPPEIDEDLLIKCAACGRRTIKRSGNQKFCRQHSYGTPEGRRWQRQHKRR